MEQKPYCLQTLTAWHHNRTGEFLRLYKILCIDKLSTVNLTTINKLTINLFTVNSRHVYCQLSTVNYQFVDCQLLTCLLILSIVNCQPVDCQPSTCLLNLSIVNCHPVDCHQYFIYYPLLLLIVTTLFQFVLKKFFNLLSWRINLSTPTALVWPDTLLGLGQVAYLVK